jgi:predicted nucleotidyltransferase
VFPIDRLQILREAAALCIARLKDEYSVKRAYLIGSLVHGHIHDRSDIDIVVEGLDSAAYMKALTELWDLVPSGVELNLIPFEDAFDSLKEKVLAEGQLVYEK